MKKFFMSSIVILSFVFPSLGEADICSRTSKVVGTLEVMLQKKCGDIGTSDLALIRTLEAGNWYGYIASIKEGDFENMPNLRFLSVNGVNLEAIGARTLKGLTYLKEIELAGHANSLKYIPGDLFQDTPNIERIGLHCNNLESLPTNLFKGLSKLKVLVLTYNRFSEAEKNRIQTSLPNVKVLF